MTNRLLVNPGTPQAWEIQLKSGQNRLGRGEQNDFQVNHPSVSGSHCEIVVSSAGVLLKDLGSTNGTFVNRAPVHEALLQTGQHVHLGGVEMLFEGGGSPAPADPLPVSAPGAVRVTSAPRPGPSELRKAAAEKPAPTVAEAPPVAPPSPPMRVSDFLKSRPVIKSPPAVPPPAVPPPAAPPVVPPVRPIAVGSVFCTFHPKTPARFHCKHCQKYFCDLCVTTRDEGGVPGKFCRTCGAVCLPVEVQATHSAGGKGFYARLLGWFSR